MPDLIAVGYLSDMDPVELLNRISDDPRTSETPLLFLSANSDLDEVQRAYNAGADEYLLTPYDPLVLERKVARPAGRGGAAAQARLDSDANVMARLGDILVRNGWITPGQLQSALTAQGSEQGLLGVILVRRGLITTDQLGAALSEQYGVPFLEVVPEGINPQVVRLLPEELARVAARRAGERPRAARCSWPCSRPTTWTRSARRS